MPYTYNDTVFQPYKSSIGTEKLFEDLTLFPKYFYSDEELNDKLLIDYSNDVYTFLDFDSLNLFLADKVYIGMMVFMIFSLMYSVLITFAVKESFFPYFGVLSLLILTLVELITFKKF